MQKKFYDFNEAAKKLDISLDDLKKLIQERSIYVIKDKATGKVMIHEQDLDYLEKEAQTFKEDKSGDQYYPIEKVMKLLQIEEDELKLMISEGKVRSYKIGGKVKFKKDEIDKMKRELMIEPTIVMGSNIDDDSVEELEESENVEELEEVTQENSPPKGYSSLRDINISTGASGSSSSSPSPVSPPPRPVTPSAEDVIPSSPVSSNTKASARIKTQKVKSTEEPPPLEEVVPESGILSSDAVEEIEELIPDVDETLPISKETIKENIAPVAAQKTGSIPATTKDQIREPGREQVIQIQDFMGIYIHEQKLKLYSFTLAVVFNTIALIIYFLRIPSISFRSYFHIILAVIASLWNFYLFSSTRKQEHLANDTLKNFSKHLKDKSSLKVRSNFFRDILDTLESAFPVFGVLLLCALLWIGLIVLAVMDLSSQQ